LPAMDSFDDITPKSLSGFIFQYANRNLFHDRMIWAVKCSSPAIKITYRISANFYQIRCMTNIFK
jgi:hypothetical protein